MILTEYDEKRHKKSIYKEGYEEGEQAGYSAGEQAGRQAGRYDLLKEQVRKKRKRGESVEAIAAALEEEPETIRTMVKELDL